ncbi:glycosyltransferase family 2 protein [Flavobacterium algoritolerans]|uniref:Glycosyltransferase family 2 protein n=1 Tax=Flavobacterium algoritolerans TaxID=3041254 RepID=A0ABT6V9X7_9FLAO|nr:glycosyltransferase family 2 protein [Flavobacterium algoritolerans]MDI5895036.1 glycosyltransferase family 2 protein [Flavobacterium algoritolerans]
MNLNLAPKISVLVITLNEEANMQALLVDLGFADEIIIVDSCSTDKTKSIAQSFSNVRFIENRFENYSSQRNFAISQAKNDWILFLDADERLTPALKEEIIETLRTNKTYSAFLFYRKFMFENTVLHFSGLQTDKILRLFDKNFAKYSSDRLVHEKLTVNGKIGVFKNKLLHYSYSGYKCYKSKATRYGKLKAQEQFIKKQKPSFTLHFLHPSYNFLYNYFIRLGFLDGKKGITICYLNAYSVFVRYQELKLLWDKKNIISRKNI